MSVKHEESLRIINIILDNIHYQNEPLFQKIYRRIVLTYFRWINKLIKLKITLILSKKFIVEKLLVYFWNSCTYYIFLYKYLRD